MLRGDLPTNENRIRFGQRQSNEGLAWIEQHQPVTWIMSGCRTGSVNFNYTTIEPPEYRRG